MDINAVVDVLYDIKQEIKMQRLDFSDQNGMIKE